MAKQKQVSNNSEWETVSTGGFAPMWKPQKDGETVIVKPSDIHFIPGKGKRKDSFSLDCILMDGTSTSFYQSDKKMTVEHGDKITIPLSYNLVGDDRLAVEGKGKGKDKMLLSRLALFIQKNNGAFNIRFDGKVKGGQGSVKRFTIMAPKGFRERALSSK